MWTIFLSALATLVVTVAFYKCVIMPKMVERAKRAGYEQAKAEFSGKMVSPKSPGSYQIVAVFEEKFKQGASTRWLALKPLNHSDPKIYFWVDDLNKGQVGKTFVLDYGNEGTPNIWY